MPKCFQTWLAGGKRRKAIDYEKSEKQTKGQMFEVVEGPNSVPETCETESSAP